MGAPAVGRAGHPQGWGAGLVIHRGGEEASSTGEASRVWKLEWAWPGRVWVWPEG